MRAQIVQLEKAGYNPGFVSDSKYPSEIQAAQARIDVQNGTAQAAYGGVTEGSAQSGSHTVGAGQYNVVPTDDHH